MRFSAGKTLIPARQSVQTSSKVGLVGLGYSLLELNRRTDACEAFRAALQLNPHQSPALREFDLAEGRASKSVYGIQ